MAKEYLDKTGLAYFWNGIKKYVKDEIDDVDVGGRNLLLGTGVAKTATEYTSYYYMTDYGAAMTNTEGDTFTASFDFVTTGDFSAYTSKPYFYVQFNGSSTQPINNMIITKAQTGHYVSTFQLTSAQAASTVNRVRIRLRYVPSGCGYTITHLKLEKGDKATDWTLAPEEMDAATVNGHTVNSDVPSGAEFTDTVGGRNYFAISMANSGFINSSGARANPSKYSCVLSDFVPTEEGELWSISSYDFTPPWVAVAFYDENKTYISDSRIAEDSADRIDGVSAPAGAYYIRGSARFLYGSSLVKLEKSSKATAWSPAPEDLASSKSPNLCPFFSLDFNADPRWSAYGSGFGGTYTFTKKEDGWTRIQCDNSQGSSAINGYFAFAGHTKNFKPDTVYTFLVEVRNNNTVASSAPLYCVNVGAGSCCFYGTGLLRSLDSLAQSTFSVNLAATYAQQGDFERRFVKLSENATSGHWGNSDTDPTYLIGLNSQLGAGGVLDYEVRMSVYEGTYLDSYVPYIELDSQPNLGYVTPQMFGAKADGETDDTAAIQKALDSSLEVYFPPGVYMISSTLSLQNNAHIWGVMGASKIRASNTFDISSNAYMIEQMVTHGHILINDLELDCNDVAGVRGVRLLSPYNDCVLRNVHVNHCCGYGIHVGDPGTIDSSHRSQTLVVDNCFVYGAAAGISMVGPLASFRNSFELNLKDTKLLFNSSNMPTQQPCLYLDHCVDPYVRGCSFAHTKYAAIEGYGRIRFFRFIGNTYENIWNGTNPDAFYDPCSIILGSADTTTNMVDQGLIIESLYYNAAKYVQLIDASQILIIGGFKGLTPLSSSGNTNIRFLNWFGQGNNLTDDEYIPTLTEAKALAIDVANSMPAYKEYTIATTANSNVSPWGAFKSTSIATDITNMGPPASALVVATANDNPASATLVGNNLVVYSRTAASGIVVRLIFMGNLVGSSYLNQ